MGQHAFQSIGMRALGLAMLMLGAQSCSGESSTADSGRDARTEGMLRESGFIGGNAAPIGLDSIRSAGQVLHTGQRFVQVFGPAGVSLAYRESVACDGGGRFSLLPVEALVGGTSDWQFRQRVREGFMFRYRDFAIRDADLFAQNYTLTSLAASSFVAGRHCDLYSIQERVSTPRRIEIAVDRGTGLILHYVEFDTQRLPTSSMEYESLDLQPDLSGAIWFESLNDEIGLDVSGNLAAQFGEVFPKPRLLPAGYALRQAFALEDDSHRWVKLVYSDGVQPLFYLFRHADGPERQSSVLPTGGTGRKYSSTATRVGADEVNLFRMGAAGVAQASLADGSYVVVGKVDDASLVDMIESATN